MLGSILASGLAVGAVYALVGVTYNVMFATSRVMSFTAGQLGVLGGVLGSLFILRLRAPPAPRPVLTPLRCAPVRGITPLVAGGAGVGRPPPPPLGVPPRGPWR